MKATKAKTTNAASRSGMWLGITLCICAALTAAATTYWKCVYDTIGGSTVDPSASCGSDCGLSCIEFTANGSPPTACYDCDTTSNPLATCDRSDMVFVPSTLRTAPCKKGLIWGCNCGTFTTVNSNTNYVCYRACAGTM